jgi:hypothetical protein
MKTFTLSMAIAAISLSAAATGPTTARPKNSSPRVYIMMKHGKLVEYNHGATRLIKKDVNLINESTIHPNGVIDAGSGQNLRLKEGQYITMDGRIRNLKDMYKPAVAKTKAKTKSKTAKQTTPSNSCALAH